MKSPNMRNKLFIITISRIVAMGGFFLAFDTVTMPSHAALFRSTFSAFWHSEGKK